MVSRACMKARRAQRDMIRSLRADPYYLGDEAYHYGQPEKTNPFAEGTEPHADWQKGFRDAEFEARKRGASRLGV